jgi:hypothetical protein
MCFIPVLLSIIILPFFPLYIDTGVNAVYARKTTVSNRINSAIMLHQVLPALPSDTSQDPLEPKVQALIGNSSAASGSTTVFGDQVRDVARAVRQRDSHPAYPCHC